MSSDVTHSTTSSGEGSDLGRPGLQQPVAPAERIRSLDVLRGVAVLGILVIDIWGFALPQESYVDVDASGGNAKLNLATWVFCSIVFEGKMRTLFSMMFGAGVILLTSRIEARGGQAEVTDIYYRRTLWLLAFGVVHAFLLLWAGDILFSYALVGLLLFPFRKMRAESLIVIGLILLAVLVPKRILHSNSLRAMQTAAVEAETFFAEDGEDETTDKPATSPEDQSVAATEKKEADADETEDKRQTNPDQLDAPPTDQPDEKPMESPATETEESPDDRSAPADGEAVESQHDAPATDSDSANPPDDSVPAESAPTAETARNDSPSADAAVGKQRKSESEGMSNESSEEQDDGDEELETEEETEEDKIERHKQAKKQWEAKLMMFRPTAEQVSQKIELHRSSYWENLKETAPMVVSFQSTFFYKWLFWDAAGMIFIGMGLIKLGAFSTERPTGAYVLLMAGGYGIGLPITIFAVYSTIAERFDVPEMFRIWMVYDAARLAMALGHVGLVMLMCKARIWPWLTSSLAAAGRMALSNYIAQTVICTLLFNGYGLALYGRPQRWHAFLLVIAIWIVQLILSTYWLKYFRYGPLEWLWRSLTYVKRQPIFAREEDPAAPVTS
jgi:uncharacterized membrane protein YeiB